MIKWQVTLTDGSHQNPVADTARVEASGALALMRRSKTAATSGEYLHRAYAPGTWALVKAVDLSPFVENDKES